MGIENLGTSEGENASKRPTPQQRIEELLEVVERYKIPRVRATFDVDGAKTFIDNKPSTIKPPKETRGKNSK